MTKTLNPHLINIVSILSDGKYHDGTAIGNQLGLTRSAIWKLIKKLSEYGLAIQSVKGKGYTLLEPVILLDQEKIQQQLPQAKVLVVESINSTNAYIKTLAHQKTITICLSEQQTAGKGRLNREWYSPFGKNIYLSFSYFFQKDISELAGLSLVVSLATVRALKEMGIADKLFVKWPNDILYDGAKLSGNLIEVQGESNGTSHAVIGIGMNVNMTKEEGRISQNWTSLQKIQHTYIDRNHLAVNLLNHLFASLQQFNSEGFTPFISEWINTDCLMNQPITLKNLAHSIRGKATGINEQGQLLLQLEDGKIRAFSSGDASIEK